VLPRAQGGKAVIVTFNSQLSSSSDFAQCPEMIYFCFTGGRATIVWQNIEMLGVAYLIITETFLLILGDSSSQISC
jgi:hypothetical protein